MRDPARSTRWQPVVGFGLITLFWALLGLTLYTGGGR
jgi:hypothetical protein